MACVAVAALALAPAARATLLVTPQGTPVDGAWQHWADESLVPGPARVTFSTDPATIERACWSGGAACAIVTRVRQGDGPWTLTGEFVGIPAAQCLQAAPDCKRAELYAQLGAIVDRTTLPDAQRQAFEGIWPRPGRPTWDFIYAGGSVRGYFGSYSEWWSESYRLCAEFQRWTKIITRLPSVEQPAYGFPASFAKQAATCAMMRKSVY